MTTLLFLAGCQKVDENVSPTESAAQLAQGGIPGKPGPSNRLLMAANNILEVGEGYNYTTIQTALDDAVSGDLVIVYPGLYATPNVIPLKDRVNMYCYEGAKIENNNLTVSQDEGTVFQDINGPITCGIYGHGVFVNDTGYLGESFAIDLRRGSNLYIEADSLVGYAMALEADSGSYMEVHCPVVLAKTEHGIRTRHGGAVDLTGDLYSNDERNDGGGQAVYFQGIGDKVTINGNVVHEGGYGAIFSDWGAIGTFTLNGNLTSVTRAIYMNNGEANLESGTITTNGAIIAENLHAKNCSFNQTGNDYIFGASVNDTAYFSNCVGNAGINPLAIWFGKYTENGTVLHNP